MDVMTDRILRRAVPTFIALAVVLLILGVCAILVLGEEVLLHVALAILLSFVLAPVVRLLNRSGVPNGLAVTVAVLLALSVIASVVALTYWQVANLTARLPAQETVIREKINRLVAYQGEGGVFSRAGEVVSRLIADVQKATEEETVGPEPTRVVVLESETGIGRVIEYAEPVLEPLFGLLIILLLTAFVLADRAELRNRFIRLAGTGEIQVTTAALDDAGKRVGRLLLSQLAINAGFGAVVAIGLWLIGVPGAILWGIVAGVLRFVPYVGAILGVVPPLIAAFAFDPGWTDIVLTIALFALVEPLVGHVIEPLLYGHSAGLSPVAILVMATLWSFLWGPVGLILATPLTVCLVVVGRHVPRLAFLDILLGDKPALEPHEMFYQRMLAGDPLEAIASARTYLRDSDLVTYYDDVALEALRRAHTDIVRNWVTDTRLTTLVGSIDTLVRTFRQPPKDGAAGVARAAILHGDHPLDPAAAGMLAQVLEQAGIGCVVARIADAEASRPTGFTPQTVLFSFVEPLSTLHLRANVMKAHRCAPGARQVVCIWQETDPALLAQLRRRLHVESVATTTRQALAATTQPVRTIGKARPAVVAGRA